MNNILVRGRILSILIICLFILSGFSTAIYVTPELNEDEIIKNNELNRDNNNGLISHWTFDENNGSITYDNFGNNNGTINGAVWINRDHGSALYFDGIGDYVDMGDDSDFDISGNISISLWFKTSLSQVGTLVNKLDSSSNDNGYWLGMDDGQWIASGRLSFKCANQVEGDSYDIFCTNASFNDGLWHHVVGLYTPDGVSRPRIYVDGLEQEGEYVYSPITYIGVASTLPFRIGQESYKIDRNFTGSIDDVRVYNQYLNQTEVLDLYNVGNSLGYGLLGYWSFDNESDPVHDDSGWGNDGIFYNATKIHGVSNNALLFDGVDDDVYIGDLNSSIYAFNLWVRPDHDIDYLSSGEGLLTLKYHSKIFVLGICTGAADNETITLADISGPENRTMVLNHTISQNKPTMLTVSWNISAGRYDIYINGEMQIVTDGSSVGHCDLFPSDDVKIGRSHHAGGSEWFGGMIDEVRMYDRSLNQSEIQELYDVYNIERGLTNYWNFEDGSGNITYDQAGIINGSINGASWVVDDGALGNSLFFDGSDDYITFGDLGTNLYCYNLWVKPNNTITKDSGNPGGGLSLHLTTFSTGNNFGLGNFTDLLDDETIGLHGVPSNPRTGVQNVNISSNKWHMITFNWNASRYDIYIDGVSQTVVSSPDGHVSLIPCTDFDINRNDSAYVGMIDEVRVYDRSLNENEIEFLYNQYEPVVSTYDATGIEETSATLFAYLSDDGGTGCQAGFEYGVIDSYGSSIDFTWKNRTMSSGAQTLRGTSYPQHAYKYSSFSGTIKSVQWNLRKANNPTGNIYAYIRWFSNKTEITSTAIDVSTLSTSYEWYEFNFTEIPLIDTDILVTVEYPTGNDDHFVWNTYNYPDNGESFEQPWIHTGASWISYTLWWAIKLNWDISSDTEFSKEIDNLTEGQLYHFRTFANNGISTVYGSDKTFLTKPFKPSDFTAANNGGTKLDLTWNKGNGANYTYIERNASNVTSWNRGEGIFVYNETGTFTSDTGLNPLTNYSYQAWSYTEWADLNQWSDNYNSTTNQTLGLNLNDTLIAHWDFNEGSGSTVNDISGNTNHGTIRNDYVNWIDKGKQESALEFFSAGEVYNIPSTYDDSITTSFTISSWVYWYGNSSVEDRCTIFDSRKYSPINAGFYSYIRNSGQFALNIITPSGYHQFLSNNPVLPYTWSFVTGVFDSQTQTIKLYINGELDNTHHTDLLYYNTPDEPAIGNNVFGGSNTPLNGMIDELSIYNKSLIDSEILYLYNQNKYSDFVGYWSFDNNSNPAFDDSGHNNTGVINGATWISNGISNGALEFDGNDLVSVADSSSLDRTDAFTILAWFKPKGHGPDATENIVVRRGPGYQFTLSIYDKYNNSEYYLYGMTEEDGGPHVDLYSEPDYTNLNQWQLGVYTYDGGNYSLYYGDGKRIIIQVDNERNSSIAPPSMSVPLYFGSNAGSGGYFIGTIDEIMIYNRSLNENEIEIYYNQYTTISDGLVGYWAFEDGSNSIANDSSGFENDGTITGASWVSNLSLSGSQYALDFDGSIEAHYVLIDESTSLQFDRVNNLTLAAWIKWDGTVSEHSQGIIDKYQTRTGFNIGLRPGENPSISYNIGNGTNVSTINSNIGMDQNLHHIVCTWDGSHQSIYIDGALDNSKTQTDFVIADYSKYLEIGNRWGYSDNINTFNGIIDEVRIYNRALNETEIILLYENLAHIYVDDDADPGWYDDTHVATIQEGIDNASAGETIYVYSGSYHENIIINKSLNLMGENEYTTFILGDGNSPVVNITADYVNVSGFTIINDGRADSSGISISNSDNNQITDTVISNCGTGINLSNSNYNQISSNVLIDNLNSGLELTNSFNCEIYNNMISENGNGIILDTTHNINLTYNDISGNIGFNASGSAIQMLDSYYNNLIQNNITDEHLNAVLISQCNISNITYNTIADSIFGVNISQSSSGITVEGNNISSNNQSGIIIDSIQNLILNNTITSCGTGISILNNENNISYNNLISNNNGLSIQSDNNYLSTNNISYNNNGLLLEGITASNNDIIDNKISFNQNSGISLGVNTIYNNISNNNISSNGLGVNIFALNTYGNNISNNNILGNGVGANINGYSHNISSNNISLNLIGINVSGFANNITNNNISGNSIGANINGYSHNISSNNISLNLIGINVSGFANNISSNNISINNIGVDLTSISDSNNISSNNISFNDRYGVAASGTTNNIVGNNIESNEVYGVEVFESSVNISDNIFINDGIHIANDYTYSRAINTVIGNTVNGKPLMYNESNFNQIISTVAGQIVLVDCQNITIANQDISNTSVAIQLWNSSYCNLTSNNISNNYNGIQLSNTSSFNNITVNNVSGNSNAGTILNNLSNNNSLIANNFTNDGITIVNSFNNTILNNLVNGLQLLYLEDEVDEIVDFPTGQIIVLTCDNINISNQNISDTDIAIQIISTSNTNISNCNVSGSNIGLLIEASSYNNISGCNLSNNDHGIFVSNVIDSQSTRADEDNRIYGNTFSNNIISGAYLDNISGYNVYSNNLSDNVYGVYVNKNGNHNITCNNITNNNYGIYLSNSFDNSIYANNISGNVVGLDISGFANNISSNNISSCFTGVVLNISSYGNSVVANNISSCNISGLNISGFANNISMNNISGMTSLLRSESLFGVFVSGVANNISMNNISGSNVGLGVSGSANNISANNISSSVVGLNISGFANNISSNNISSCFT
ncbi:LamG-like jellyroll fold domain-containing protein, partial [Thermoplasmatota archaeon]